MIPERASVVIVGSGPTGLMLAIELGRRGVDAVVISDSTETSRAPKATVTQARTMEHFRRVGLAERVRATGVPGDHPTDIVYCTRVARRELARHRLPSPNEARRIVREAPDRWHAPELTHRSSQMWIEPILLAEAQRFRSVSFGLGQRLVDFVDDGDGVTATVEDVATGARRSLVASFVVGCDGAASTVRTKLGIGRGDSSAITEFKGRPMFSVHARAPAFFERVPFGKGWLFAAVNPVQRGSCISLNGVEFKFSFWRPDSWTSDVVTHEAVAAIHREMFGADLPFEIIDAKFWRGGASLVADAYRRSRVFIAGDAAHLFTPSAGLGYCSGIDDAANLGWKLAAVVQGWGGPALLDSYEIECRPEALRRTRFAAECAERLAIFKPTAALEAESAEGSAAREAAAAYFASHLPRQYDIPGINFGARFDDSPVVASEPGATPEDGPNVYVPRGRPGGRAPHVWLTDGRSLYDAFGAGFTLLRLAPGADATHPIAAAARAAEVPLMDLDVSQVAGIRDRYEADWALVRPDQVVAWRGPSTGVDGAAIVARVTGRR